jgi:hypothetical protein
MHTPTPWELVDAGDGEAVYIDAPEHGDWAIAVPQGENAKANAELIVRAVNSHDALVEALTELLSVATGGNDYALCHNGIVSRSECSQCQRVDRAREALKLAQL